MIRFPEPTIETRSAPSMRTWRRISRSSSSRRAPLTGAVASAGSIAPAERSPRRSGRGSRRSHRLPLIDLADDPEDHRNGKCEPERRHDREARDETRRPFRGSFASPPGLRAVPWSHPHREFPYPNRRGRDGLVLSPARIRRAGIPVPDPSCRDPSCRDRRSRIRRAVLVFSFPGSVVPGSVVLFLPFSFPDCIGSASVFPIPDLS